MKQDKRTKIEKLLGAEVVESLVALSEVELKAIIAQSCGAIKQSTDELNANPIYQEIKENLKAVSQGLREVKKYQNAKIQYSLGLLEAKGK